MKSCCLPHDKDLLVARRCSHGEDIAVCYSRSVCLSLSVIKLESLTLSEDALIKCFSSCRQLLATHEY